MANQVKHVVRLVVEVTVVEEGHGEMPLAPEWARQTAIWAASRSWRDRVGMQQWAVGWPAVLSATILLPSPVVTESDTEDLGMGEPASVPPADGK